jgi:hypothetical protein
MKISDNANLKEAVRVMGERLPPGWSVEVVSVLSQADACLRFRSKEGRFCEIPVAIKKAIDPRGAQQISTENARLVVAPYISGAVRAALEQREVNYADHTGNIRIILDEPGLFILTTGAETNPWPPKRQLSLRGIKAGRVVQALVTSRPLLGVRELAQMADTDPGYVSRLLAMLDAEALVDRTSRGQVARVDWRRLLQRWSMDAPLESRAQATTWLAPRGLDATLARLREADFRYLVTASTAARNIAPIAPARLLTLYVDDPDEAAPELELRPTDTGANIILLQPSDASIYGEARTNEGISYAPLPLVVADLLDGPGRSPAEAEALMDWMLAHEENWRG